MPEERIWTGRPSQWLNLPMYVLCLLIVVILASIAIAGKGQLPVALIYAALGLMAVPLALAGGRWLTLRCHVYEVTTERLHETTGVLSRVTHDLELYRVQDISLVQPLVLRLVGLGNIVLHTIDPSTPKVTIRAVRNVEGLRDQIRTHVEKCRVAKGVRSLDMTENLETPDSNT